MMTKPLCASAVFVLLQWSVSAYAAPASAPAVPLTNTPAAASAPAPATAPTATANRHRCYVQLGAFQNQQWAEQQVAEVALLGIKAQSYKTRTAQGDIYQVRVESLNYQQAQTILQRLKQNNINAFVDTKPKSTTIMTKEACTFHYLKVKIGYSTATVIYKVFCK